MDLTKIFFFKPFDDHSHDDLPLSGLGIGFDIFVPEEATKLWMMQATGATDIQLAETENKFPWRENKRSMLDSEQFQHGKSYEFRGLPDEDFVYRNIPAYISQFEMRGNPLNWDCQCSLMPLIGAGASLVSPREIRESLKKYRESLM